MTVQSLASVLGLPTRAVQEAVETLREQYPICAGNDGHWLATTAAEAEGQYRSMRARMRTQAVNAWRFRRVVRRMRAAEQGYAQPSLWSAA